MLKSILYKLLFSLFLIQFADGFAWASIQVDPNRAISPESDAKVDLGSMYVDIRNGFSLQPPPDCRLLRNIEGINPETPPQYLPGIHDWEILRWPCSQELIRFVSRDVSPPLCLAVYLLLTRQQMDIEKMLQARCDFWRKYPDQAVISRKDTRIVNNCPAALLAVAWQGSANKGDSTLILETLIQSEADRFFMLVLKTPTEHPDKSAGPDQIMKAVTDSFICLGKTQEEQRWKQAKAQAQKLLGQMKIGAIKDTLREETCYRVSRAGKDIGFYRVREKSTVADGSDAVEIICQAFINNLRDGLDFARVIGWAAEVGIPGKPASSVAPVYLEGRFTLGTNLNAEQADFQFICPDESRMDYRLQYHWKGDRILVTFGKVPPAKEKIITETLKVNRRIFLPFALAQMLPRFLPSEPGGEFVFMRFANRALCHCSLRMGEKLDLPQSPQNITARYLVGQMGQQGPILEIWLDESGNILKLHADSIILQLSAADQINEIWPQQTKDWPGFAPAIK